MIVKSTGRLGSRREVRIDWPLLQHAPAPVLFTQGRAWHPRARFAAAVEVRDTANAELPSGAARILHGLCAACGAQLRLLECQDSLVEPDADEAVDLLAVILTPAPTPPLLLRRLAAPRPFLSGCDLLFLRA
jgi:hypothetical protein